MNPRYLQGLGVLLSPMDDDGQPSGRGDSAVLPEADYDLDDPESIEQSEDDEDEGDEEDEGEEDDEKPAPRRGRAKDEEDEEEDDAAAALREQNAALLLQVEDLRRAKAKEKADEPDPDDAIIDRIAKSSKENLLDTLEEIGPTELARILRGSRGKAAGLSREEVEAMVQASTQQVAAQASFREEFREEYPFLKDMFKPMSKDQRTQLFKAEPYRTYQKNIKAAIADGITDNNAIMKSAARMTAAQLGRSWGGSRQEAEPGRGEDEGDLVKGEDIAFARSLGISGKAFRAGLRQSKKGFMRSERFDKPAKAKGKR